jgi:hypothetical protein
MQHPFQLHGNAIYCHSKPTIKAIKTFIKNIFRRMATAPATHAERGFLFVEIV